MSGAHAEQELKAIDEEHGTQDSWSIVYEATNQLACSDRALVLQSVGIPHQTMADVSGRFMLVVPADYVERAKFELWQYEQENRPAPMQPEKIRPDYGRAFPGVIAYLLIVVAIGWMSGQGSFGLDWYGAGRVDGNLIREGEWWRAWTALTLHGGIKHILGNIVFGVLFGILAGGLLGPGLAWLGIVMAGGLGNTLNVFLLDASHRSIGASTAVFAALGIVSGFVWRARLMAQDRWAWRLGPIVGGIALLAYTGTGSIEENTDTGAHVAGFACGFATGMILTRLKQLQASQTAQLTAGTAAFVAILCSWWVALNTWH